MNTPLIEICVEDVDGVRAARLGGADRVELCIDVACGGLTPPLELVTRCLPEVPAEGIQILIRSRDGDFVYNADEVARMKAQITEIDASIREWARSNNSAISWGFVVGAVTEDGRIDNSAARCWRETTSRRLTFHRAFDVLKDCDTGISELVSLGYERVLTTGGHPTQAQAAELRRFQDIAQGELIILASGGLRSGNVADIVHASQAKEIHMRAPFPEGSGTSQEEVEGIVDALRVR